MPDTVNLFARIEPELDADLQETIAREERDKTTIVKRALRDYVAKSRAEAKAAKAAKAAQPAQA